MTNDTKIETPDDSTEATTEEVQTAKSASLTIQDLATLRNIIDIASQRGAFKTTEFAVVGATYTKLVNFITAVTPAEETEGSGE